MVRTNEMQVGEPVQVSIDAVPGPRGPVTFRDLYLRQFVVTPA